MIEQRTFDFDKKEGVPLEDGLREQIVYRMAQLLVDYWKLTPCEPAPAGSGLADRGAQHRTESEATAARRGFGR